ncbi:PP2C family serine/threonine-protein phosphatase [Kineococcus arenarius]|uniref:PP2C family serine/threonine-protein phosphatase n=1 Tax=Kineococcus sp. SYSU DK007 TaxID=3383128 RepID=UPI003D7CDF07
MEQPLLTAGWRSVSASVPGTSHTKSNLPCQDAHEVRTVALANESALVAVVADGAGSASEGGSGARILCEDLATRLGALATIETVDTAEHAVRAAVAASRNVLQAEADERGVNLRDLACTVVVALIHPEWSVFAQIGDGAVVVPEAGTGEWNWIFWPERGEYANTTFFVTDTTALDHLQVDSMPFAVTDVALFTDGLQGLVLNYETQDVLSSFFTRMTQPVRSLPGPGHSSSLSEGLSRYLASAPVAARTDDDLSLVLAARVDFPVP